MAKLERDYYVFDGQNASTGSANRVTGRYSFYGSVLKFHSKKEALQYVEDKSGHDARIICEAGTKRTMRSYCLGMSVTDFEGYISYLDYTIFNEDEDYYGWVPE